MCETVRLTLLSKNGICTKFLEIINKRLNSSHADYTCYRLAGSVHQLKIFSGRLKKLVDIHKIFVTDTQIFHLSLVQNNLILLNNQPVTCSILQS